MFERLKQSVVESYVGAIALGWLLAQSLVHFANIFTAPVAGWILRREYRGFTEHTTLLPGFSLQDPVPELIRSVSFCWFGIFCCAGSTSRPSKRKRTNQHRILSKAPKKQRRRLAPLKAALSELLLRCWILHLRTIISD
jgi:hypothetical protein